MKRPTLQPANVPSLSCDLASLKAKTGPLQKLNVALATSKAAAESLIRVQQAQIEAEADIAITNTTLAKAAIKASLVANAMPQIGALTVKVNAATASVDQALTNGTVAETYTHFSNRAANLGLFESLLKEGKITAEEAEALAGFAYGDAVEDIQRSRQRMVDAKKAVATLSSFAIEGIEASKRLFGG